ncbi:MAG TPA: helix-turn-helix transcriptional regulator [Streptomyces sp.]|uniref:helix-turn-helix transcriptional regulator n=1 Tax=Streptomyces sp. TaxID=1931 RepID=UPI002D317C2B|nr:helix-turn-helix transcriptional regulator [Streptomyces sp.]HZG03646.1 helix-turn-helix transcriptional regulator [Streptomyces sp.]
MADELGLKAHEAARHRDELERLGLIVATASLHTDGLEANPGWRHEDADDAVTVIAPEVAFLRLLEQEQGMLRERLRQADQAYTMLETLAGRFLRAGSVTDSEVEVEVLTDYRRIQQVVEDMLDVVHDSIVSMHPGAIDTSTLDRSLGRDKRMVDEGVRVRVIYNQRFASVPTLAEFFRNQVEVGVEVRLSPVVPMNMILGDQQFALLPANPDDHTAGAILARGPALVRSYLAVYEYCWHTSSAFGEEENAERGGDGLTEQQRAALRMLATGMKDEKIARNLGVSLRTVSRLLSEVMQELGASSRFEAGVKATRLGWLD